MVLNFKIFTLNLLCACIKKSREKNKFGRLLTSALWFEKAGKEIRMKTNIIVCSNFMLSPSLHFANLFILARTCSWALINRIIELSLSQAVSNHGDHQETDFKTGDKLSANHDKWRMTNDLGRISKRLDQDGNLALSRWGKKRERIQKWIKETVKR